VLDDHSGTPKGILMAPWVVDGLKAAALALAAPGRGANGQSTVQPRSEACRVVVSQHFEPSIVTDFALLTPSQRPTPLLLKPFVSYVREFAKDTLGSSFVAA